ncbi:hypothetical protein N9W89_04270 [Hellea sp.]|nr:hypothetical protein [Hellea sp.]
MTTPDLTAPELRVPYWIDAKGQERPPLKLKDLGTGYKVIFCFKSTCPAVIREGFQPCENSWPH